MANINITGSGAALPGGQLIDSEKNRSAFEKMVVSKKRKSTTAGQDPSAFAGMAAQLQLMEAVHLSSGGRTHTPATAAILGAKILSESERPELSQSKAGSALAEVGLQGRMQSTIAEAAAVKNSSKTYVQQKFSGHGGNRPDTASPTALSAVTATTAAASRLPIATYAMTVMAGTLPTVTGTVTTTADNAPATPDAVSRTLPETTGLGVIADNKSALNQGTDISEQAVVMPSPQSALNTDGEVAAPQPSPWSARQNRTAGPANGTGRTVQAPEDKTLRLDYAFRRWGEGHSVRVEHVQGEQVVILQASDTFTRDALSRQLAQWPANLPEARQRFTEDERQGQQHQHASQQDEDENQQ